MSMSRDVLRCHPGVPKDRNRGRYRDYNDGDRKEFRHDALAMTDFSRLYESVSAVNLRLYWRTKRSTSGKQQVMTADALSHHLRAPKGLESARLILLNVE